MSRLFAGMAAVSLFLLFTGRIPPQDSAGCDPLGWFPTEFGVKDHTAFTFNGYTYIAANKLPEEKEFAYARSLDLCTWEVLDPILSERTPGDWDENRIWAPHVIIEDGVFYMFYTGVNNFMAQSIMLATSTNPADPNGWIEQGLMFQPSHPGAIWSPIAWSNNRDPFVLKRDGVFYMLYTGKDLDGGIVGLAQADSLFGPWTDLAATIGPVENRILESSNLHHTGGIDYLFYHSTWLGQSFGEIYEIGVSPQGPWMNPGAFIPGWAHEIWEDGQSNLYASYLTSYAITIRPVFWDDESSPPRPYLIDLPERAFLPLVSDSP